MTSSQGGQRSPSYTEGKTRSLRFGPLLQRDQPSTGERLGTRHRKGKKKETSFLRAKSMIESQAKRFRYQERAPVTSH